MMAWIAAAMVANEPEGDVAKKQIEIQKYRDRQIAKIEREKNRTLPTPKAAQGEAKR
jgi:hypothetical protein